VHRSADEGFLVWINEEDHLSLISKSNDGRMSEAYGRIVRAMEKINQDLEFQQHQRLGYLNFSPTNIGTALQVDMHVQLLNGSQLDRLIDFSRKLDMHIEPRDEKNVFHVSNMIRLGRTEFHIVRGMLDGVRQLIEQDLHG
jgi:protein-arginine kinase